MKDDVIIEPEWEVDREQREKEAVRRAARELAAMQQEGGATGRQSGGVAGASTGQGSGVAEQGFETGPALSDTGPVAPQDPFAEKPRPSKFKQYLGAMLSGSILSREEVKKTYKYLVGIALLMMLYIYNVFYMQHLYHRQENLTGEVRDLRAQAMTLRSKCMVITRQSSIDSVLKARGSEVHESMTPPKVIER